MRENADLEQGCSSFEFGVVIKGKNRWRRMLGRGKTGSHWGCRRENNENVGYIDLLEGTKQERIPRKNGRFSR